MPEKSFKINFPIVVFVVFIVSSVGILLWQIPKINLPNNISQNNNNSGETQISVAYAPELDELYKQAIGDFNFAYSNGKNPNNDQKLGGNDLKIKVSGQSISSGQARTEIVSSVNNRGAFKPTIYAPTFSGWLNLVNFETGQSVYDLNNFNSTAKSPVGIAIWESRLNAIKSKTTGNSIGLEDIQKVFNSPKGWQDYDSKINRQQVYFGFTNPQISSTAVSSLLTQYYSASKTPEQLTINDVKSTSNQKLVQDFQKVIRQYSNNTVVFRDYLGRGPDYIDMLPLAENDLIFVNQGKTSNKPPEKLVMLYPKEGSIVHDYPMAIAQRDWVSENQQKAAKSFIDYMQSEKVQAKFLENGFRPNNSKVALNSPISSEFGVDVNQPTNILKIPSGDVISEAQTSFDFVKKPAKITLLVDTSGSMGGAKIENAKKALQVFVDKTSSKNQISLTEFNDDVQINVASQSLESGRNQLKGSISELFAGGGTALFDSVAATLDDLNKSPDKDSIRAIVLLSDGQDTTSKKNTLKTTLKKIEDSQNSQSPILIIPIAYGKDADLNELNAIARSSKTTVQTGDTDNIDKLLETISSYF